MSTQVIIIGGGIVGVSAAYFLARRGASVTLLDPTDLKDPRSAVSGWTTEWIGHWREFSCVSTARRNIDSWPTSSCRWAKRRVRS